MSSETAAAYADALPGVVHDLAEPHVDSSEGVMVHLDWNPKQYPFQKPECFVWKSQFVVQGVDERIPYAEQLQPGYQGIRDGLISDQTSRSAFEVAAEALQAKQNAVVVTPHDKIVDIGVALLGAKDGIENTGTKVEQTAIILSKMLSGIGYKSEYIDPADGETKVVYMPAVLALGLLCETTYMSWPATDSAKVHTARLPENEVRANNNKVVSAIKTQLDNGGVLLGLAATGTTRVVHRTDGGVVLPSLSPGTKVMMARKDTVLIPMLADLEPDNLSARIPFEPANPTTDEGVAEFMHQLEAEFNNSQN